MVPLSPVDECLDRCRCCDPNGSCWELSYDGQYLEEDSPRLLPVRYHIEMGFTARLIINESPRLETKRLILRPFTLADAPRVQLLAGDKRIAATTALIPHPYPDGEAERWINTHPQAFEAGNAVNFAIVRRDDDLLIGAMGLEFHPKHRRAEVGYWIGHEFWEQGYATEALKAVLAYGFSRGVHRIWAEHFAHNPASGRVMQKAGMKHEGTLRHHMVKWDQPVDCEVYGILSTEFTAGS